MELFIILLVILLITYNFLQFIAIPIVIYLLWRNRVLQQVHQESTVFAAALLVYIIQHELMWSDFDDWETLRCMKETSQKANIPLLLVILYGVIAFQMYLNHRLIKKRSLS